MNSPRLPRSPRSPRWLCRPGAAFGLSLITGLGTLLACSSRSPNPAVLGDCIAKDGSPCATYGGSGGGGSGGGPGDGGQDSAQPEEASSCGNPGSLIVTQNTQCAPCVVASCCQAFEICAGDVACVAIVQCPAGNINSCEAQNAAGVADYNDLSACLSQQCGTQCPALPLATSDI